MRIRHGVKGMFKRRSRVSHTTSSLTLSVSKCGGDNDGGDGDGEEERRGTTTAAAGWDEKR